MGTEIVLEQDAPFSTPKRPSLVVKPTSKVRDTIVGNHVLNWERDRSRTAETVDRYRPGTARKHINRERRIV
ncbi:hypothetical protein BKA59DRAFT_488749, partial [Fusarium tricinctum]